MFSGKTVTSLKSLEFISELQPHDRVKTALLRGHIDQLRREIAVARRRKKDEEIEKHSQMSKQLICDCILLRNELLVKKEELSERRAHLQKVCEARSREKKKHNENFFKVFSKVSSTKAPNPKQRPFSLNELCLS